MKYARSEISERMFKDGQIKSVFRRKSRRLGLVGAIRRTAREGASIRQTAASLMQEAGRVFRCRRHAKLAHVDGVQRREVDASSLMEAAQKRAAARHAES